MLFVRLDIRCGVTAGRTLIVARLALMRARVFWGGLAIARALEIERVTGKYINTVVQSLESKVQKIQEKVFTDDIICGAIQNSY